MIPKIFHRIWLGEPEPERFSRFWNRLRDLHPGWELKTWSDPAELTWLRNQEMFDHWYPLDPFGRIPDILRYELLARYGGVYIDADVEPLKSFDPLVEDDRPFIGWEDDKECSTAILASPAGHPAIEALIDNLPEWVRTHAGNPVAQTGPRYATAQWKHRDDVRRFAPYYFYSVSWREMQKLWPPYPPESFAIHHWASGWKTAKEKQHVQDISLIVPGANGSKTWAWLRRYWECYLPEAQIVECADLAEGKERAEGSYLLVVSPDVFLPVNAVRIVTQKLKMNRRGIAFAPAQAAELSREATKDIIGSELLPAFDMDGASEPRDADGLVRIYRADREPTQNLTFDATAYLLR